MKFHVFSSLWILQKWGVLLTSLALMFFLSVCPVLSHKFTQTWKWLFRKIKKKKRTRKSLFNLFLENISKLLHLTGRAPNTKRLNLKAVGVEVDQTGAVKVTSLLFWYSFCFIQRLWLIQFIFPHASVCLSVILNYLTLKFYPAVPFSVFWALSWLHAVWTTNSNAELQFFF